MRIAENSDTERQRFHNNGEHTRTQKRFSQRVCRAFSSFAGNIECGKISSTGSGSSGSTPGSLNGIQEYSTGNASIPRVKGTRTEQPMALDNNSALLDLPNVHANLPPPLTLRKSHQVTTEAINAMSQPIGQQAEAPIATSTVSNSKILESIQSITKVMQQQLMFSSKIAEQGIIQMASLFQEMIKAQEKIDLDPDLLTIPTFSGEAVHRHQCLDWVSRVKNVCH